MEILLNPFYGFLYMLAECHFIFVFQILYFEISDDGVLWQSIIDILSKGSVLLENDWNVRSRRKLGNFKCCQFQAAQVHVAPFSTRLWPLIGNDERPPKILLSPEAHKKELWNSQKSNWTLSKKYLHKSECLMIFQNLC